MEKVIIFGGYGAVGREAAEALVNQDPAPDVVLAGRDPSRARSVPGTTAVRVDASDEETVAAALEGVDAAVMCAEVNNPGVARACLERGVHYLDVSADHHILTQIEGLDLVAREHDATAVLSVGLAPGVTNLLAAALSPRDEVSIGVLLGTGEEHGRAALEWTLRGLGKHRGSWRMRFPDPYGTRAVHRFPFSDQYTLLGTLGLRRARTGLCMDSRLTTALLAAAGRPAVGRLLNLPKIRETLLTLLTKVHLGGDGFAVTAAADSARATFSGRRQSLATGLTAALLVRRLPSLDRGVHHIEQLVDPAEFLNELAAHGFDLQLGSS